MSRVGSARSVVITGASSGLGAQLARLYAGPDVSLALIGRDPDRLAAIGEMCEAADSVVSIGAIDIRDSHGLAAWLNRYDETSPVDVVIAAAGISGRRRRCFVGGGS